MGRGISNSPIRKGFLAGVCAGLIVSVGSALLVAQTYKGNFGILTPFAIANPAGTLPVSGAGVLASLQGGTYTVTVPNNTGLSLLEFGANNTSLNSSSGSNLYVLKLNTQASCIDCGAGLMVQNTGFSDGIYIADQGQPGAPASNAPCGLCIDVNRNGAGQNSTTFSGAGLQIWDWSTSDISTPSIPQSMFLRKLNNRLTNHYLLHLEGDRRLLTMVEFPGDPGWVGGNPVVELQTNGGLYYWQVNANGNQLYTIGSSTGQGIFWSQPSGNQLYVVGAYNGNNPSSLDLKGASGPGGFGGGAGPTAFGGIRMLNNAGTAELWRVYDNGLMTLGTSLGINVGSMPAPATAMRLYSIYPSSSGTDQIAHFFGMSSTFAQTTGPQGVEGYVYNNPSSGTTNQMIATIGNAEWAGTGTSVINTMEGVQSGVLISGTTGGTNGVAFAASLAGRISGGTGTITTGIAFDSGIAGAGFTNLFAFRNPDPNQHELFADLASLSGLNTVCVSVTGQLSSAAAGCGGGGGGSTLGPWTDVGFNAANYTTNSNGSITPQNAIPYLYRYQVSGSASNTSLVMTLQVAAAIVVNNGTTTEIRVAIPGGHVPLAYPSIDSGTDNIGAASGFYNSTASGILAAFIDVGGPYISLQRWDGVAGAGFPNGQQVFVRFTITIPLIS